MIAGRYRLDREVGRGGMGAVWLARDEILGRAVAAKRVGMAPGGAPDLERAEREARIAASLNHPHVVAVYDLVTDDDQQWLVMEYVEGRSLAEMLRADGPLDPDRAAVVLGQVADALATAHGAGIVHRDVKPSNILVTADDHAKLTDFGIARAQADVTLTQTGMVTGSPAYLAPEIASGSAASAAGDVWSVGATLFHAATGHPPYDTGENVVGTLYQIVHQDPPRLPADHPHADVVAATMVKDPAARWSMAQVRARLVDGPGAVALPVPPVADPDATQAMTALIPEPATLAVPVEPDPQPEPEARPTPPAAPVRPAPVAAPPVQPVAGAQPQPPSVPPSVPPAGPPAGPSPRRRGVIAAVLAAALVAAVLLAVVLWPDGDGEETPAAGDGGTSESSPPAEPTSEPTTADPSAGVTDEAATEKQLRDFVSSYLSEVTADPRAAFGRLTPGFQASSGGFSGYTGFWGTIAEAKVSRVKADAETLQVSYRVRYRTTAGRQFTDDVTLQLVRADGTYLIDGEA